MKTVIAAFLAAVLPAAAMAQTNSGSAPQRLEKQGDTPREAQAGTDTLEVSFADVAVEGPVLTERVDTAVVCKVKSGAVADCDPENVKDPKSHMRILNKVQDKIKPNPAWRGALNPAALKTLTPRRETLLNKKINRLTAKLLYLNAAGKVMTDTLEKAKAQPESPETLQKLQSGMKRLTDSLSKTEDECEKLQNEKMFAKHFLNCKDGSPQQLTANP